MTRYMLDTDIISDLVRNPQGKSAQIAKMGEDIICTSIIVAAELLYGCAKSGSKRLLRAVEYLLRKSTCPLVPFTVGRGGIAILRDLGRQLAVFVHTNFPDFHTSGYRIPFQDAANWRRFLPELLPGRVAFDTSGQEKPPVPRPDCSGR